jgi:hypothetical protein
MGRHEGRRVVRAARWNGGAVMIRILRGVLRGPDASPRLVMLDPIDVRGSSGRARRRARREALALARKQVRGGSIALTWLQSLGPAGMTSWRPYQADTGGYLETVGGEYVRAATAEEHAQ